MPNYYGSQDFKVFPIAAAAGTAGATGNINVRNTNVQTAWIDTRDFEMFYGYVQCDHSTWNSADGLTTLKYQQCSAFASAYAAGTGTKDVTTSGAASNYNTTNDTLTASDSIAIIECRAEDMDVGNNFRYLRLYAASTGNTGADNLFGFVIAWRAGHKKRQLQGAYAAATLVYVNAHSNSS
jgi:hypothetical protein